MTELRYTIPLAPITKKNSQRILTNPKTGKPFIKPSQQYEQYAAAAAWYLRPRPAQPITQPVTVQCVFYMPTRRRVDRVNLEEAIHDVLVSCGVLADDNRDVIASGDGTRVLYDKEKPRTEITITEYEGEYTQWHK